MLTANEKLDYVAVVMTGLQVMSGELDFRICGCFFPLRRSDRSHEYDTSHEGRIFIASSPFPFHLPCLYLLHDLYFYLSLALGQDHTCAYTTPH